MSDSLNAHLITKDYPTSGGSLNVLRGVSLEMKPGDAAVIMGPSGSGKSTLLNILGTLESPTGGSLTVGSCNPFGLPEPELARFRNRQIGFVFQDHHLLPQCSVLENVLVPTLVTSADVGGIDRAHRLLDRVGLSDRLEHRPAELSGGERQRVAVARALINRPTVVLADEPTGNLDQHTAEAIADLLLELHRLENTILVTVTHSVSLAERFDRRYELRDGTLLPFDS